MRLSMEIEILSSIRIFFESNRINHEVYMKIIETTGAICFEPDSPRLPPDDREIPMEYEVTMVYCGKRVKFPALMQQIDINLYSGRISGFYGWMPADDMVSFEKVYKMATQMVYALKHAGFIGYGEGKLITKQAIASVNGSYTHSMWTLPIKGKKADGTLELDIDILSSMSFSGSTTPPIAALFTSGGFSPVQYGLRIHVQISDNIDDEVRDLDKAMKNKLGDWASNRVWYDNPDWRPEGWNGNFI